jgi:hypothetical protein
MPVSGFTPFVGLYGFGGRTGGASSEHRVDNVLFVNRSGGNDCDGDLVPDAWAMEWGMNATCYRAVTIWQICILITSSIY